MIEDINDMEDFTQMINIINWIDTDFTFESKVAIEKNGPRLMTECGDNIYLNIARWDVDIHFPKAKYTAEPVGIMYINKIDDYISLKICEIEYPENDVFIKRKIPIKDIEFYEFEDKVKNHDVTSYYITF
jgi:hypothetical protein